MTNLLLNRGSFGVDDTKMGAFGVHGAKKWENFLSERSIFLQNACQAHGNFKFRSNFC